MQSLRYSANTYKSQFKITSWIYKYICLLMSPTLLLISLAEPRPYSRPRKYPSGAILSNFWPINHGDPSWPHIYYLPQTIAVGSAHYIITLSISVWRGIMPQFLEEAISNWIHPNFRSWKVTTITCPTIWVTLYFPARLCTSIKHRQTAFLITDPFRFREIRVSFPEPEDRESTNHLLQVNTRPILGGYGSY